jgi:lipid-A-disaccharide synthase-like uncharacterized protein
MRVCLLLAWAAASWAAEAQDFTGEYRCLTDQGEATLMLEQERNGRITGRLLVGQKSYLLDGLLDEVVLGEGNLGGTYQGRTVDGSEAGLQLRRGTRGRFQGQFTHEGKRYLLAGTLIKTNRADLMLSWPLLEPLGLRITGWKLIGLLGTLLFAGRWLVQMYASRRAGRPVTNLLFWIMSAAGSLMLLSYFVLSPKQDMVGVLSNLFPVTVAGYNLFLEIKHRRGRSGAGAAASPARGS